jgi:outer membrane lipoprotein carrier protein
MALNTKVTRAVATAAALVVSAAAVAPLAAQSGTPSTAILERAMQRYRAARTVDVSFTQTVTNPLTQHSLTSRGELQRERPNLLSITFSAPASDRIVADGRSLWVYLPSSAPGQVMKLPAAGERGILLDPLGQILGTPLSEYTVTPAAGATIDGHDTQAFTLTPRSQHAVFTRATVWVDDGGVVRQLEATEPSGLVRRIAVTQFRANVSIPRSAFRYAPPAGVRVVDQTGRLGTP